MHGNAKLPYGQCPSNQHSTVCCAGPRSSSRCSPTASSAAGYDRGRSFALYRIIETLREYVPIDPDERTVEVFRRTGSGDWLFATQDSARGLVLKSLDFEATLEAVFEDLPSDGQNSSRAP